MTTNEAKKDVAAKLAKLGIIPTKLTARTVGFGGFGFGNSIFVTIHNCELKDGWKAAVMSGVPKPSEGGYCLEVSPDCFYIRDGKKCFCSFG